MASIIHLRLLLIMSAVIAVHERERLALSVPGDMRDWHEENSETAPLSAPPKWQRNPVFCCVCQDIIKQTKPKIDRKIQMNINTLCSKFVDRVKRRCLTFGGKLKKKLLKSIFPGRTPKDTCRRVKLCMY